MAGLHLHPPRTGLEHALLKAAAGLPGAGRQRAVDGLGRRGYRDVEYADQRTVVELDGRLGHEWSADRWADLDRDLAAAEDALMTLRVGWRQVLAPCRLGCAVGRILSARGWRGVVTACAPGCPAADTAGSSG